jgi:DNA-binding NarL/FixJ family response regulator
VLPLIASHIEAVLDINFRRRRRSLAAAYDAGMAKAARFIQSILGISPADADAALANLTEREREVAEQMATGKRNRQIAEELGIASKTLDIHRAWVKRKLRVNTSIDVARYVFASQFGERLGS